MHILFEGEVVPDTAVASVLAEVLATASCTFAKASYMLACVNQRLCRTSAWHAVAVRHPLNDSMVSCHHHRYEQQCCRLLSCLLLSAPLQTNLGQTGLIFLTASAGLLSPGESCADGSGTRYGASDTTQNRQLTLWTSTLGFTCAQCKLVSSPASRAEYHSSSRLGMHYMQQTVSQRVHCATAECSP